jgi:hypothetical protein
MTESTKAVFLSYASQVAQAARQLAMRSDPLYRESVANTPDGSYCRRIL